MSDWGIYAGDTDKTIYVWLQDSTTGLGKTGLTHASSGILLSYVLPLAARAAITPATQTVTGAHSDGGFVEVDATNIPGLYRLDLPDAAIASGAFSVVSVKITGVKTATVLIPLGYQKTNLIQIGGDTQSGTDLKDFADAGYDPSTHKVQGVVLVDTTTTNADMRGTDNAMLAASYSAPPSAATISTQVASDLATAHGAGSWATAIGFSTHSAADVWGVATRTLSSFGFTVTTANAGDVTAILADTNELQADWADGGRLDLLTDALTTNLAIVLNSVVLFNGLVQDASATASGFNTNLTQADDWFEDKVILFVSGNLQYQSKVCSSYLNANGAMTFDEPFTAAPDNGSNFYILAIHAHTISQIQSGLSTQTSVNDLPTNAELAAAITTGLTTALTEGYRATGATGSVRDLLYELLQSITEFTISGTTKTVKKLDGSTTAKTYTLNDGTTPTGITEAT